MKINLSKIDCSNLRTPTNFAKEKSVDRKYIYQLFAKEILDYIEIDGVKFVFLNQKAIRYKKNHNLK